MTRGYDPAKAKYSQSGDVDTKLLEQLIPQYDRRLLSRMIYECKAVIEDAQGLGLRSNSRGIRAKIVPLTIRGAYGETSHYTIDFTSPLIRYVPPEFISLHRTSWYTRTKSVEYLPCYIMNLNRVVLAKFYLSDSAQCVHQDRQWLIPQTRFYERKIYDLVI